MTMVARRLGTLTLTIAGAAASASAMLSARPALAQYGGGMGAPGGMQPPPPMGQEPKEEGPAEEAPEEEGRPADLEPLAEYAEQNRRKMQIFEVNGYLRLRTDYMHNFFLGQGYSNLPSFDANGNPVLYGLPPFPVPLECPTPVDQPGTTISSAVPGPGANCGNKNIGGANMRLRVEPTLNVTDQVRVHSQIDILDNTILGSTPDSLAGIQGYNRPPAQNTTTNAVSPMAVPGAAPVSYLYTTQDPPEVGKNGFLGSIVAKRAWGEVDSEFGSLRFGRMPWNWGRGMYYNDGSCPDCDVGTTVDRVMALTQLYGHQIMGAWDLGPQGYTTTQLGLGFNSTDGYPYDLSQDDDVLQLMGAITKIDSPVQLRERIDRGDVVLNYGFQFVYRNQGNTVVPQDTTVQVGSTNAFGPQPLTREQLKMAQHVGALVFTPDLWVKMYYKSFTLEIEGIGIFGKVDRPGILAADPADANTQMNIRQVGWIAAGELRLYRDSFFVGFETGGATGDQAEDSSQYLNYRWHFVQQPSGDHDLSAFHFSPDYHVDQIFFRHIMGTVTNAIYFRPSASYWFDLGQTRAVGLLGNFIYSMAPVPVATPGNSLSYGVEMDLSAMYRNTGEGFYAGVIWGVFWPMGALERPGSVWGVQDQADATAAQILRIFFGIRY